MSKKTKGRIFKRHCAARSRKDSAAGGIRFRIRPGDRALIDEAAFLTGKSRSEFILAASLNTATDVILDRRLLRLTPKVFFRFIEALDAPPNANDKLRKLLSTAPPWQ